MDHRGRYDRVDDMGIRSHMAFDERRYVVEIPHSMKYQMGSCGIAGAINVNGEKIPGSMIETMITTMAERENGLGAGFVCYGLFPDHTDEYCLQFLFDDDDARREVEEFMKDWVEVEWDEKVYTSTNFIRIAPPFPLVRRYFALPKRKSVQFWMQGLDDDDYIVRMVMLINAKIKGAFCVSSGKNMAVFKGSGYARDIAKFYDIFRYSGEMWLSHSRFPTNSPGWWAGAHPISILDWSVCHNGEITSYGVNKKYVEMFGYNCALLTDSETITYLWDLLVRRHGLPVEAAAFSMAPQYYSEIERMGSQERELATRLRMTYKEAFLNGPFSILVGRGDPITMIALADRKKLRPMVVGRADDDSEFYVASEECAIKAVNKDTSTWTPKAGNPVVIKAGEGLVRTGLEPPFQGVV